MTEKEQKLSLQRAVGWNGIQLNLPKTWEVIVNGPHHLLIEEDLTPLFELRWENSGGRSDDAVIRALQKTGGAVFDNQPVKSTLPGEYKALKKSCNAQGLSWREDGKLNAIFWRYEHSKALVFCHLHENQKVPDTLMVEVLGSIHFQPLEDQSLWSVQDFQLSMPREYSFTDSTFAAGLSRLGFRSKHLYLQFCRIAPATERLQQVSLRNLLTALQDSDEELELLHEDETMIEQYRAPSTMQQVLIRLRRKRPFFWGRIWHLPEQNRLLAVTAESIRPIAPDKMHSLCATYEII